MYFWIHLLSLAAILLLPKLLPPPRASKEHLEKAPVPTVPSVAVAASNKQAIE